jgi:hypothetical protein
VLGEAFGMPWTLLWLVAVVGMLPAVGGLLIGRSRTPGRMVAAARVPVWAAAPALVLVGVLALRAAVIFSAQA